MHAECWKLAVTYYHSFMAVIAIGVLVVAWNIRNDIKRLNRRLEAENAKGIAIHALLSKRRAS